MAISRTNSFNCTPAFLFGMMLALLLLTSDAASARTNDHHSPNKPPLPPADQINPQLRWGPVLGLVTPDSASIKWATTAPATCALELQSKTIASTNPQGVYHGVLLTDLKPDTAYTATISISSRTGIRKSPAFSFRTPPANLESFSFVAMGDTRTNHADHQRVVQSMLKNFPRPAFIINTGDLVENGQQTMMWDKFFDIERPIFERLPFIPAIGNHEKKAATFFGMFQTPMSSQNEFHAWHSFRYGNAVFVILDPLDAFPPQTEFLDRVLARAKADGVKWKFVVWHAPAFSSGSHGNNPQVIQAWVPLLEKYGVTCGFFGHDHLYEHSEKSGVVYLTLGGGGAPLYSVRKGQNPYSKLVKSVFHSAQITVSPDKVDVKVEDDKGGLVDSFSIPAR